MKWFNEALTNIYQPYDVRGLYNQHRLLVLDTDLYDKVMVKLDELKEIHRNSSLDLKTIDGIIEDIESDKDNLLYYQEEKNRKEVEALERDTNQGIIETFNKKVELLQCRQETFDTQDDSVSVYIDPDHMVDVLARVEKEAISQVLKQGMNRAQTARALGISYRTLTNKLRKYFKNAQITD
jgi:DNA-binding protein Fis